MTTKYKAHEAAGLFPLMSEPELAELAADIKKNGLQQPIVLAEEDLILDGRNRMRACQMAGVEPEFVYFDRDLADPSKADPVAFVVSANIHRRHLEPGKRALIAAKLATLGKGANQHTARAVPSQEKAAEMLNVSADSVQRARTVIEKGAPELVAAVEKSELPLKAAAAITALPKEAQKKLVERGPAAVAAAVKEAQNKPPKAKTAPPASAPSHLRLRNWSFLPEAPLPTDKQWKVLRVALFKFLDLAEPKAKGNSSFAKSFREVGALLGDVANNPTQVPLIADTKTPTGTHAAQARSRTLESIPEADLGDMFGIEIDEPIDHSDKTPEQEAKQEAELAALESKRKANTAQVTGNGAVRTIPVVIVPQPKVVERTIPVVFATKPERPAPLRGPDAKAPPAPELTKS